ncbi:hypothetical protein NOR_06281 [Metarhizium rileyi]|uniref:DUF7728 domain-containing protein n=1 Tax=Metarhizium rileyi (strain RCEF 4871) TaxID=1649241 RepID=A0A167AY11_METRR|nr:hypothetical protein NOR_06281 [Metarhizium rileyi RCEF 4871]
MFRAARRPRNHTDMGARKTASNAMSTHDGGSLLPSDQGQRLNLRCKQCPSKDGRIRLEFTVEDRRKLLVNGFELFPSHGESNVDESTMTAPVHDVDATREEGHGHDEAVGYELSTRTEERDETEAVEVVELDYRIRQVGHRAVQDVPTVHVRLVKLPDETILLGILDTSESHEASCGAVQCWAHKLGFVGTDDAIASCCSQTSSSSLSSSSSSSLSTSPPDHASGDVDWHFPTWKEPLLPGLPFLMCSCILFALLAMIYMRRTEPSQNRGKSRGVQFWAGKSVDR